MYYIFHDIIIYVNVYNSAIHTYRVNSAVNTLNS